MKTQEQQKAELLDKIVADIIENKDDHLIWIVSMYAEITAQKPLTADPYADEIFSGRILKAIYSTYHVKPRALRLSECPSVKLINQFNGFGRKSREEYIEAMTTYEMWDKI